MCSLPQKDMDPLELELTHMVNFPLLWESLVHVSNSDQGIKCYNQRMIILTGSFFQTCGPGIFIFTFLLLLLVVVVV